MKIGIISDTHDHIEATQAALSKLKEEGVEKIFHLGDWCSPFMLDLFSEMECPIIGIFGNNDADIFKHNKVRPENLQFKDRLFEIELNNKRIVLVHGDPPSIVEGLIRSQQYDVVLHGHSHIARIEKIGKVLVVNPGSMIGPFYKAEHWTAPSVAIYDTEKCEAKLILLQE